MKDDRRRPAKEHRPVALEPAHLPPERRAVAERLHQPIHAHALVLGQGVRIACEVDRREARVEQRVRLSVDGDGPGRGVDAVQELPVPEAVLGVAAARLPFELPLDDGHRFLHARHRERVAKPLAFHLEPRRRVVAVDGPGELLDRSHRDAEALLELPEAPVAERDAEHRGDERLLTKAGAHPARVMVPPGDAHPRLPHQELDDAVEARPAITEVAGDHDLRDREVANDVRGGAEEVSLAAGSYEGVDERLHEHTPLLNPAGGDELAEEAGKPGREQPLRVTERVAAGELAQDLHLAREAREQERPPVEARLPALPGVRLARVVDDGEQAPDLVRRGAPLEEPLDERAQAAGGVVDDVLELLVLAVHVADDVNGPLGERLDGLEVADLRERSL